MCTVVITNGFPKSGTNLLTALLDLLNYSQVNGSVASILLYGKWSPIRRLIWGSRNPQASVLVGEQGDGNSKTRHSEIRCFIKFLDIQASDMRIDTIQARVFIAPGRTFHRGKIGYWKQFLTEQHLGIYRTLAADITQEWGYRV